MKRIEAIVKARKIMEAKPVILDTETTGLRSDAEICEISIIDWDGSVLFDSLVRPINGIPEEVTAIHGITEEDVKDAPTFAEIKDQVQEILSTRKVIIYNQSYDTRILRQAAQHSGVDWEELKDVDCLMMLYSRFSGEINARGSLKWHKLVDAAEHFNIITEGAHRAKADCIMTLGVLQGVANSNE